MWLKLQQIFKEDCAVQGETPQSAISFWKRPRVYYSDEWVHLHKATSLCLTPNAVIDFLGRSICRYKVGFSQRFERVERLLLSCRYEHISSTVRQK